MPSAARQVPAYALKEFGQYIVFGVATLWLAMMLGCTVRAVAPNRAAGSQ